MKYPCNPFLNAIVATAYVWGIVLLIHHIASLHRDTPDNLAGTAAALSLLVFSVAIMGFLFFYRPAVLILENKRKEAISFFLKTVGTFGLITLLLIFALL